MQIYGLLMKTSETNRAVLGIECSSVLYTLSHYRLFEMQFFRSEFQIQLDADCAIVVVLLYNYI